MKHPSDKVKPGMIDSNGRRPVMKIVIAIVLVVTEVVVDVEIPT